MTNQFSVFPNCHCIQATQGKRLGLWDGENVNAIFKVTQQDRKLQMRELHGRSFYPSNQETCICLQVKALYVKKKKVELGSSYLAALEEHVYALASL